MGEIRRRMYSRTMEDGSFDTGIEEYDVDAERDAKARDIAEQAQATIGEAYQSPFTFNAAYEAARILLTEMAAEADRQQRIPRAPELEPHLARRALENYN
jgi:hypothetical protein